MQNAEQHKHVKLPVCHWWYLLINIFVLSKLIYFEEVSISFYCLWNTINIIIILYSCHSLDKPSAVSSTLTYGSLLPGLTVSSFFAFSAALFLFWRASRNVPSFWSNDKISSLLLIFSWWKHIYPLVQFPHKNINTNWYVHFQISKALSFLDLIQVLPTLLPSTHQFPMINMRKYRLKER